jgi:hypothetical protein
MRQLILILLTLGILSCNSGNSIATKENRSNYDQTEKEDIWTKIDKKKAWFLEGSKTFITIDSLPVDFNNFYSTFISDTTFQKEHIEFPILGAIAECDSTIILTDRNWEVLHFDFRSDFYNPLDSNTVTINKSKILIENYRKEIGIIFQIGFEKKNDDWFLTLIMINNC